MTAEQAQAITHKLIDCMDNGQKAEFIRVLDSIAAEPANIACSCIAMALMRGYTSYRADAYAAFLEIALHHTPEWGSFAGVQNPLFRASLLTGSVDLYECFIEEVPGLDVDFFVEAYAGFSEMNERMMDDSEIVLKGRDYNSGVPAGGGYVMVDQEDFEVINDTMEKYNAIVNRYKILKDIEKRM